MKNLCIDIGNTFIKLYLVEKSDKVTLLERMPEWDEDFKLLAQFIEEHELKQGILSSVRHTNTALLDFLQNKLNYFINLSPDTPVPINNQYEQPQTLGKDRLGGVVAANHLFPDKNCLYISSGTCITYDFIDHTGKYWGGSIAPGMYLRFKSLNDYTDKLPFVKPQELDDFIGKTTEKSILTGVIEGFIAEIDGRIQQYEARFGSIQALITGGDALFFEKKLKNEIFAHPNLLPIGLNKILEYNIPSLHK